MFELYGIDRNSFPNNVDAWTNGLHPEDKKRAIDESIAALTGEKEYDTSFRVLHPDGKVLLIKANAKIIRDAGGTPLRITGINSDITGQKLAEEKINNLLTEKELLLKEVHHRIKNNMNTIVGMLSLQMETLKEPSAIAASNDARSRVVSIMLIYDKLYRLEFRRRSTSPLRADSGFSRWT